MQPDRCASLDAIRDNITSLNQSTRATLGHRGIEHPTEVVSATMRLPKALQLLQVRFDVCRPIDSAKRYTLASFVMQLT